MTADRPQEDSLLERGRAALRAGDRKRARELLSAAVRADPDNPRAWLWLSGALDDPARQGDCLRRVLALDPGNAAARAGLEALETGHGAAQPHDETQRSAAAAHASPATPRLPPPSLTLLLGSLGGVSIALAGMAWRGLGTEVGPAALLGLALLAGVPLGLMGLLIGGVLLRIAGRAFGGRGDSGRVRAGLAWAAAPQAISLLVWLAQLVFIYQASFGSRQAAPGQAPAASICLGLHGLLALVSIALAVAGVAAAHRFSLARAVAAWLLAALIVPVALVFIFASSALLITLRGG